MVSYNMSMRKRDTLKFNDPAPDVELLDLDGGAVRISSLWQNKVLVLAFTRHFGCPQCKEMLDQLGKSLPDLAARGLNLAVITQGTPQAARDFCAERAPAITCLADPERKAYRAYGLRRASMRESILNFHVIRSNRRLKKEKGWKPESPPPGQDALQMSGVFIIAPDGRIRLPYYYDDIADHPSIDLLLNGMMGMDWKLPLNSPIDPE